LSYAGSAANASIRGSKTAELLSRCAVESGTSTYYKAIAESVDDQVLKLICTRLAKDEINHFSVFRRKMDELKATEQFGFLHLLKMSLSRLVELEDDQVSYAYYIGLGTQQPYGRRLYSKLMIRAAYGLYTKQRISELIKLNLRALGISKSWVRGHYDLIVTGFTHVLWCYIRSRVAIINLKLYIQRGRI
jgi:hypothetical protein